MWYVTDYWTPRCAHFKRDCRVNHEHAAWTRRSERLMGHPGLGSPLAVSWYPWKQNTHWGFRKYFVRSALLEATADKSVVSTQRASRTRYRRMSGRSPGAAIRREDQLCIKLGCRLGAIIAGQACDVGFWHLDTDDAVGTQVHHLGIMQEAGLYSQYAWYLALVQVQGITDVWQRVGLAQWYIEEWRRSDKTEVTITVI